MEFLANLWLPILLSAVGLFFASFIAWTVLPHHKGDFRRLPDEKKFEDALKALGLGPGNYAFPFCANNAQMKDPEFQKRFAAGPNGTLSVWPQVNMGKNLVLTFVVQLAAVMILGSLLWTVLQPGASFGRVFEVASAASVLTWCVAFLPNMIWFAQSAGTMVRHVLDGVAYALVVGVIFAALWPGVA